MKFVLKPLLDSVAVVSALMTAACSPASEPDSTTSEPESKTSEPGLETKVAEIKSSNTGQFNAMIDGVAYRAEALNDPSKRASTAEFRDLGVVKTVKLQVHNAQGKDVMSDIITVEFSIAGDNTSAPVTGVTIAYWPNGMDVPFYSSEGSETESQVTLKALSMQENDASVTGQFVANLCRKDEFFSEADGSDCVSIKGTFDTGLRESA